MFPPTVDRSKLVNQPGVYQFFDDQGILLYVGKAINLNKRVTSYFQQRNHTAKTVSLVEKIHHLETIVVQSELEALILEANLIKKYLPPYNIRLTDDKDYLYIKVTKEEFPRILTARKKDLTDAASYFGPFPSSTVVKVTLKKIRRIFSWCSNPPSHQKGQKLRPCFYFHIGLCPGACVGNISAEDYKKNNRLFVKFMDGKSSEITAELEQKMQQASESLEFEKAGQIKRILEGIQYITQPTNVSMYLDNPNFLENQRERSLEELQMVLHLPTLPVRIECYDISNIQGENATGSMVVLTNGEIDKSQYRRFKIKITGKPNDFAMHAEMMRRRLKHQEWPLPDLFLIDGGRGQVRASAAELVNAQVERPIFGLAKREEWLYPVEGSEIKLPKRMLALRLLQRIRDESHRFAITYHRKLRNKAAFQ